MPSRLSACYQHCITLSVVKFLKSSTWAPLRLLLLSVRGVAGCSLALQNVARLFDLAKSSERGRNSPQIGPELLSASSQRVPQQMGSSVHITQPDTYLALFRSNLGEG